MSAQRIANTTTLPPEGEDDRILMLLAGEALGDLSPEEQTELDALAEGLSSADRACMELSAGALASCSGFEEPPAHLSERLLADARDTPLGGPAAFTEAKPEAASNLASSHTAAPNLLSFGGWLAAAACLLVAFVVATVRTPEPLAVNATADIRYANFLQQSPADMVEYEWAGVAQPGAGGKVVWSDEAQEGYMVFQGLAANDPSVEQYQLWIFDGGRSEPQPVDGGVFDIKNADGETVVAIDPKILVREGAWFAVTVEQPGGVVVSDQSNIPVVANMPSS